MYCMCVMHYYYSTTSLVFSATLGQYNALCLTHEGTIEKNQLQIAESGRIIKVLEDENKSLQHFHHSTIEQLATKMHSLEKVQKYLGNITNVMSMY